jgi:hypothetical protein
MRGWDGMGWAGKGREIFSSLYAGLSSSPIRSIRAIRVQYPPTKPAKKEFFVRTIECVEGRKFRACLNVVRIMAYKKKKFSFYFESGKFYWPKFLF